MAKSNVKKVWDLAGEDLGVEVVYDYSVVLSSGATVVSAVFLPQLGARRGMIVVHDYQIVKDHSNEIREDGYAFSVLDEPEASEVYERNDFVEMLSDWGWSGPPQDRPEWFID